MNLPTFDTTDKMSLINKLNFHAKLPEVLAKLKRCAFVAVDLEMTGIQGHSGDRNRYEDDMEDRYPRMVPVASKYSIIQVGLTFFEQAPGSDAKEGSFVASPYAFFVFPEWGADVVMSASSITFLKQNNMDFNQWIINGVPYSDARGASNLREIKEKRDAANAAMSAAAAALVGNGNGNGDGVASSDGAAPKPPAPELVPEREADREKLAAQKAAIAAFVADATQEEYVIPPLFPFVRKCVYQYIETQFPALRTKKGIEAYSIVVMKVDQEQQARMDAEDEAKMNEKLGFRLVWEALCSSKKPIVGHNCMFDLLFLFRWMDRPLPPGFLEFKSRFSSMLGEIFDTKYLANSDVLGAPADPDLQTDLGSLYKSVVTDNADYDAKKHLQFAEGFGYNEEDKQAHDAGYDSFMTGAIFARYIRACGMDRIRATCRNRMFMFFSMYSCSLAEHEPHSLVRIRGDIYHLSGFKDDTVTDHVYSAGFLESHWELKWLGAQSMFLISKESVAAAVPSELPEGWRLLSLKEYEASRELMRRPQPTAVAITAEAAAADEEPEAKKVRTSDV